MSTLDVLIWSRCSITLTCPARSHFQRTLSKERWDQGSTTVTFIRFVGKENITAIHFNAKTLKVASHFFPKGILITFDYVRATFL